MIKCLILSIILTTCFISSYSQVSYTKKDLKKFCQFLSGSFNSLEQSKKDTDYFHITLKMKPIWKERTDGYWFYVEQAMASKQDKPYRQRIYKVCLSGDTAIASTIFTFSNPLRYAGAWKDKNSFKDFSPDSLTEKEGCTVFMTKKGNSYNGGTRDQKCPSDLRGASFTTTIITLYKNLLISWDRGFNSSGTQVWGAEKGGYLFVKDENWPLK